MKQRAFWENFIIIAIILVIVQTFLDEYSMYSHWSVENRNILLFSGFFFDLLFSIEFTVRSILAGRKKQTLRYWLFERGWVDFLSSFPLLFLNSGPSVYLLLSGQLHEGSTLGILNILKVVKAIRVTRILRLVRIIKILGKIHNADSKMAQHHTAAVSTTAVFTIIVTLMLFSFFTVNPITENVKNREIINNKKINRMIETHKITGASYKFLVDNYFSDDKNVMFVKNKGKDLLAGITEEEFDEYYDFDDYTKITNGDFTVYISLVDIKKQVAFEHIEIFFIIVFTVIAFMFVYTRHFVQTISDIIHILNKGLRKKDYNLQIKMRGEFSDQEISSLARFYNDTYLPAKLKRIQAQEQKKSSGLSMNDLMNFKKK